MTSVADRLGVSTKSLYGWVSDMEAKPAIVAANQLRQDFNVDAPDTVWVTGLASVKLWCRPVIKAS